ncbi:DUF1129 family protein [Paenibacillus bouchesdurhonensis]|uniref:DUF1129 family protein n=1 Tax=Paenibacillus bouchesdurhonensis TaxID=1870990 RepID=UPI0019026C82|nr:DUF1129 family protein [Paenibacillus bouchesdurhonensis]
MKMKIKEFAEETNRLRAQMTPENEEYFGNLVVYLRSSRIAQDKVEELLLETAQHLMEAQRDGKTAREVFGENPEKYFQELIEHLPKQSIGEKISNYVMIPWIALTWMFAVHALFGFISIVFGAKPGLFNRISLFSILMLAFASIAVIEIVLRILKRESVKKGEKGSVFNMKIIAVYLGFMLAVILSAIYLHDKLPTFEVAPWLSLLLFAVGLAGQKFIFLRDH